VKQDIVNLRRRYVSDWALFNQLIFASAVYVFFTNLLPGITFASDLYVLTGKSWGTIEVVFSTGLCGIIFSLYVILHYLIRFLLESYVTEAQQILLPRLITPRFSIQPLTILGVTGPFSVLAENIYAICDEVFQVHTIKAKKLLVTFIGYVLTTVIGAFSPFHGLVPDSRSLAALYLGHCQCS
jgi:hypothetical protein